MLGNNKFDYAKKYCLTQVARSYQGKLFKDYSKGTRLTELNVVLSQTVMVCSCSFSYLNLNAYLCSIVSVLSIPFGAI